LQSKTSELIFPARGKPSTPFNGWSKAKAQLDQLSGVHNWTLHDLRRSYATNMARLGVPLHVIERLLNHVSGSFGGIVSVYRKHQYMDEMREAVHKYENWLKNLLDLA
jgi:integrase